jgi:hypothetical protein
MFHVTKGVLNLAEIGTDEIGISMSTDSAIEASRLYGWESNEGYG